MSSYDRLLTIFMFLGYILKIILFLIPIIIIIYGIIDLIKYITTQDKNANNIKMFIRRLIYAVFAFFVTTIILFVFNLINNEIDNKYFKCFTNPSVCKEVVNINKNNDLKNNCKDSKNKDECCKLLINNDAKYNDDVNECTIPVSSLIK